MQNTRCEKRPRGGTRCCVPSCTNVTSKNRELSWHRLPSQPDMLKKWLALIGRAGRSSFTSWKPKKHDVICGMHFNASGRRQKDDKFPLYHIPKDKSTRRLTAIPELNQHSATHSACSDDGPMMGTTQEESATKVLGPVETLVETSTESLQAMVSQLKQENGVLTNKLAERERKITTLEEENVQLRKCVNELKQHVSDLQHENFNVQKSCESVKKQKLSLDLEVSKLRASLHCENSSCHPEELIKDETLLPFYTSFKTAELFESFAQLLKPQYSTARQRLSAENFKRQNCRALSYRQQLIMTLMYLRLGLLEQDLAHRFHVSQSVVSYTLMFWLHFLRTQLAQMPMWPSREIVTQYLPSCFVELYPNTRIIIDCTEIFIQTAADYNVQSATYSQYKSHNTAKGLIGVTPNGFISFVSELYGGRISDKEITIRSGLLDRLEKGDGVMADRGFLLEDMCNAKQLILNIPPFLHGKKQFSVTEDEDTKKIAAVRIHVERVIGQVKRFRILQFVFPNSSHTNLNDIWQVSCYLCNFNNTPLLDRKRL